jgi:hypothetical protein
MEGSLAQRRTRRQNVRAPKRFRDDQPALLPSLPPATATVPVETASFDLNSPLPTLKSHCNTFGLFRQYRATSFPAHDPDANSEPIDLSDVVFDNCNEAAPIAASLFQPYPNQSAFLLGEWYWNEGSQKSKDDFKKLVGIITDPAFRASA